MTRGVETHGTQAGTNSLQRDKGNKTGIMHMRQGLRMKHKERNIGKGKGDETQSQTGTQKEIHNIETKY